MTTGKSAGTRVGNRNDEDDVTRLRHPRESVAQSGEDGVGLAGDERAHRSRLGAQPVRLQLRDDGLHGWTHVGLA